MLTPTTILLYSHKSCREVGIGPARTELQQHPGEKPLQIKALQKTVLGLTLHNSTKQNYRPSSRYKISLLCRQHPNMLLQAECLPTGSTTMDGSW